MYSSVQPLKHVFQLFTEQTNHSYSILGLHLLKKRTAKKCALIRSPSHALTLSELWYKSHKPIWNRERTRSPVLTPMTHEGLIPYDGCQSPAVDVSATHRLTLSSPCDYIYFPFSVESREGHTLGLTVCIQTPTVYMCRLMLQQEHDVTTSSDSQGVIESLVWGLL